MSTATATPTPTPTLPPSIPAQVEEPVDELDAPLIAEACRYLVQFDEHEQETANALALLYYPEVAAAAQAAHDATEHADVRHILDTTVRIFSAPLPKSPARALLRAYSYLFHNVFVAYADESDNVAPLLDTISSMTGLPAPHRTVATVDDCRYEASRDKRATLVCEKLDRTLDMLLHPRLCVGTFVPQSLRYYQTAYNIEAHCRRNSTLPIIERVIRALEDLALSDKTGLLP